MNWRDTLSANPADWTWAYDYDTFHMGAVDASIRTSDDTCGFEIAFSTDPADVDARFDELRSDGWPAPVLDHARTMYDTGVKLGTLGTPHKPSWER